MVPLTWDCGVRDEILILRKGYGFTKVNLLFGIKKIGEEFYFQLLYDSCLANKITQ